MRVLTRRLQWDVETRYSRGRVNGNRAETQRKKRKDRGVMSSCSKSKGQTKESASVGSQGEESMRRQGRQKRTRVV